MTSHFLVWGSLNINLSKTTDYCYNWFLFNLIYIISVIHVNICNCSILTLICFIYILIYFHSISYTGILEVTSNLKNNYEVPFPSFILVSNKCFVFSFPVFEKYFYYIFYYSYKLVDFVEFHGKLDLYYNHIRYFS